MDKSKKSRDIEREIIARAMKDPAFRAQLIANPRDAIEKSTGIKLVQRLQIEVIEQKPDTLYLLLPKAGSQGATELTEGELEGVAGGFLRANFRS